MTQSQKLRRKISVIFWLTFPGHIVHVWHRRHLFRLTISRHAERQTSQLRHKWACSTELVNQDCLRNAEFVSISFGTFLTLCTLTGPRIIAECSLQQFYFLFLVIDFTFYFNAVWLEKFRFFFFLLPPWFFLRSLCTPHPSLSTSNLTKYTTVNKSSSSANVGQNGWCHTRQCLYLYSAKVQGI